MATVEEKYAALLRCVKEWRREIDDEGDSWEVHLEMGGERAGVAMQSDIILLADDLRAR